MSYYEGLTSRRPYGDERLHHFDKWGGTPVSNTAHFFWSTAIVLIVASICGAIVASDIWGRPAQPPTLIELVQKCAAHDYMRNTALCGRILTVYEESNSSGRRRDAGQQ